MDFTVVAVAVVAALLVLFFLLVLREPFSAFVLMLPFVVVTRTVPLPLVGERFTFFDCLMVLWWLGVLVRYARGKRDLVFPRGVILAGLGYGGFILASVLSLVWAPSLIDGLIALSVYLFLGAMGLAAMGVLSTKGRIETIARVLVWLCLGAVLVSLWEALATGLGFPELLPIRDPDRLTGPFRNPNQLGTFLIIAGGFAWSAALLWPRKHRWWLVCMLAIGGIVLLLSSSRTNIIAGLAQMVLLLALVCYSWARKQSTGRGLLQTIGLVALVATVSILGVATSPSWSPEKWEGFSRKVMPFVEEISDPAAILRFLSGEERIVKEPEGNTADDETFLHDNWTLPIRAFRDSPMVGVGLGNFRLIYEIAGRAGYEIHSQFLSVLAETGIVGFIGLLLLVSAVVWASLRLLKHNGPGDWLSLALVLSLWPLMISGVYVRFLRRREFWILVGMLLSYLSLSRVPRQEEAADAEEEAASEHPRLQGHALDGGVEDR